MAFSRQAAIVLAAKKGASNQEDNDDVNKSSVSDASTVIESSRLLILREHRKLDILRLLIENDKTQFLAELAHGGKLWDVVISTQ